MNIIHTSEWAETKTLAIEATSAAVIPEGATMISSLWKRVDTYSGYCLQAKRADGVTLDIGFAISGYIDVASLLEFAGAQQVGCTIFYNQAGTDLRPYTLTNTIESIPIIVDGGVFLDGLDFGVTSAGTRRMNLYRTNPVMDATLPSMELSISYRVSGITSSDAALLTIVQPWSASPASVSLFHTISTGMIATYRSSQTFHNGWAKAIWGIADNKRYTITSDGETNSGDGFEMYVDSYKMGKTIYGNIHWAGETGSTPYGGIIPNTIGAYKPYSGVYSNKFLGKMKEMIIYMREITQEEVTSLTYLGEPT